MDISEMTLVGSGAQADVYLYENKAVKVFKPSYHQANARREADLQDRAYKAGLPVPAVYEVVDADGRTAIIMEYISGRPLGEIVLADMENIHDYLELAIDLQINMHSTAAAGFPSQKDKLEHNIAAAPYLNSNQKQKLVAQLQNLESDNCLCHGDFHILNLIRTTQGVKIIDWADASNGSSKADVCRSYLLYLLYRSEVAKLYLDSYCSRADIKPQDVLKWLPVIAGARLNENVTDKDIELLVDLINNGISKTS